MASGSTNNATADRWGGGVCVPERGGLTQGAAKSGEGYLDLQGDMADGRSEISITIDRVSDHEGGFQGTARFSARGIGG